MKQRKRVVEEYEVTGAELLEALNIEGEIDYVSFWNKDKILIKVV